MSYLQKLIKERIKNLDFNIIVLKDDIRESENRLMERKVRLEELEKEKEELKKETPPIE